MKIFIDHFRQQDRFVIELTARLKNIDSIEIHSYSSVSNKLKEGKAYIDNYQKFIKESDIIIPIITSEYLAKAFSTDELLPIDKTLTETISNVVLNGEKRIFPFIYSKANWSSVNWIVKRRVFPESGDAYSDLPQDEKSLVIDELVTTITNVFYGSDSKISENIVSVTKAKKKNKEIFISHSHTDADFAELLTYRLKKEGIDCWLDFERLKVGQEWREEIDLGISSSKAIIAIMSPEARKSEYVTYEWAYAWGQGIKVFPIMLLQTTLHPRLESLQYLDFTNHVTRPYDELVKRIKELKK